MKLSSGPSKISWKWILGLGIALAIIVIIAMMSGCAEFPAPSPGRPDYHEPTPAPTATNQSLVWAWGWTAKFGSLEQPIGWTSWGIRDGLEKPTAVCAGTLWFHDETQPYNATTLTPAKGYPLIGGTCKVTPVVRVTIEEAKKMFFKDSYTENLQ